MGHEYRTNNVVLMAPVSFHYASVYQGLEIRENGAHYMNSASSSLGDASYLTFTSITPIAVFLDKERKISHSIKRHRPI